MADPLSLAIGHDQTSAPPPTLQQRRNDLDGLRGVAILSVVAFHFDEQILPGGYVGVDIFFVLSGFLMARQLLVDTRRKSFAQFFARRLQRLLPALAACLAVVTFAVAITFGPNEFAAFGDRLAAVSIFSGNILFWAQSGYFAPESKTIELLHLWSLGVEGQWYLFVPVLYGLLRLFKSPRWQKLALVFLAALSCCFALYCAYHRQGFGFYMFPARLWQFLLGAIVATSLPPFDLRKSQGFLSGVGLALVLAPMVLWPVTGSYSLALIMLASLGTAMLIGIGLQEHEPKETKILHLPFLTFAGRISYSWYLWHWPLLTLPPLFLMRPLGSLEKLVAVFAAICAASLSTFLLELPILARPVRSAQRVIIGQLCLIVAFLSIGSAVSAFGGFPQRVSPEAIRADRASADFQPQESCTSAISGACKAKDWSIVIWGDSHAEQWVPGLSLVAKTPNPVRLGRPGCPPLPGVTPVSFVTGQKATVSGREMMLAENCLQENQAALAIIEARADVRTVVLAAAWSFYSEGVELQTGERRYLVQMASDKADVARSRSLIQDGLDALIARLRARGKAVWLIGDTPAYRVSPSTCMVRSIMFHRDPGICSSTGPGPKSLLWSDAVLTSLAAQHKARAFLPSKILCQPGQCAIKYRGQYLYRDSDHITSTGATILAKEMFKTSDESTANLGTRH